MSVDESDDCSIEEQQQEYFLDRLPKQMKGRFRCRLRLQTPPGTTVLFQYKNHIVASAVYQDSERRSHPDRDGYTASMIFDPASIRVFAPVGAKVMNRIWPRDFSGFSHGCKKGSGRFLLVLVTFCVVAIIAHCGRNLEWQLFGWRLD